MERTGARGMLRVDPEPFDRLTAPREIEGRFYLPRSPKRGLRAVEGSSGQGEKAHGLTASMKDLVEKI